MVIYISLPYFLYSYDTATLFPNTKQYYLSLDYLLVKSQSTTLVNTPFISWLEVSYNDINFF